MANGWSELVGLGGTFVLGYFGAPGMFEESSIAAALLAAAVAIIMGTLLEGVLVGWAQGRVLRVHLAALPLHRWVIATAVGAGVAWTLGMLPSTLVALFGPHSASSAPPNPEGLVQHTLAAGLGAVLGVFLGIPQAWVLRRHVRRGWSWVAANALAWAVAMPHVFQGMDSIGADPAPERFVIGVAATCLAAGLVVGAIHGRWLQALLRAHETSP